jgi:hypothetical protein
MKFAYRSINKIDVDICVLLIFCYGMVYHTLLVDHARTIRMGGKFITGLYLKSWTQKDVLESLLTTQVRPYILYRRRRPVEFCGVDFAPSHTNEEVEDADFAIVARTHSTIVLPTPITQGSTIRHLSRTIPTNEYGLPLFYIRGDLIDWTSINAYGHIDQEAVEAAAEGLNYDHGYPTQQSGSPFWVQLAHEPFADYQLFKAYLDLSEQEGIRVLDTLAEMQQVALDRLQELALCYYWNVRARAYDLFIVAATAKKREARIRRTEDEHFTVAGGILDAIINRINAEPELIAKMEPDALIDMFEKMVKVQRLSLGLTGQAASTNVGMPNPGSTVEVILRQLTQNAGLSGNAQDGMQDRLALLMGDPDAAMKVQELIIRTTTDNTVYQPGQQAAKVPGIDD